MKIEPSNFSGCGSGYIPIYYKLLLCLCYTCGCLGVIKRMVAVPAGVSHFFFYADVLIFNRWMEVYS